MRIIKILLIIGIMLLISVCFFVLNNNLTAQRINKYSYTKAICDKSNFCQDYKIICDNGKLESLNPITGATIQNSNTWQDPRENKTKNFCE